jgi:CHASE2 domain-containing sensor protein/tRNA A-37 threonylcarbamoyl transferase component Bud32
MKLDFFKARTESKLPQESFIRRHPGHILYLLITLFVIALFLEQSSIFEGIENRIQDAMFAFRGEQPVGDDIVLLNIDDKALDYLGWWPWSHSLLAQLIEALDYYQPQAIYLDLPIENNVEDYVSGNSHLLAENILQSDNIVFPFDVVLSKRTPATRTAPEWLQNSAIRTEGIISSDQVELASRLDLPEELFGNAAKYLGANITFFENDNSVRNQPLIIKYENKYYPAAELILAANYLGLTPAEIVYNPGLEIKLGERSIPVNNTGQMLINYFVKTGKFASRSVKDMWEGQVNIDELESKLVIVSLTATGHFDQLKTPLSKDYSPAEKTATVIQNIIKGNYIYSFQASTNLQILVILGIGLFCAFLIPRIALLHRFVVLIVFLFVLININFILFSSFNTIAKTFYPALEIVLFMIGAPMMKGLGDGKKDKSSEKPAKQAERSAEEMEKTAAIDWASPTPKSGLQSAAGKSAPKPVPHVSREETPVNQENCATQDIAAFEHSSVNIDEPLLDDELSEGPLSDQEPSAIREEKQVVSEGSDEIKISFDESGRPSQFGRYEIIETLGQGAMGTVYKGLDPAIGRPVALKTIRFDRLANPSEINELKERFMLEAKAAGSFSHPNIVTIYDVGQDKRIQYIAMEYLEGHTLEQIIKRKLDFNYRIVAKIISQVCKALDYAHERNVIHRDIKPANIMVLDGFKVKVMDFGIAHFESSEMTQTGIAMGTPNYISPEQLSGKKVTVSADIFSLGVVMYELLTGTKPFTGDNISNLIMKILNNDPVKPSLIDSKIPPLLDHVVMKALEKDPLRRYNSAKDMASALEDYISSFSPKAVRY